MIRLLDVYYHILTQARRLKIRASVKVQQQRRFSSCSPSEFSVACLARNPGAALVKKFVEHYNGLGAKNILFLDNGSSDDSFANLGNCRNVSVSGSRLPYKKYQNLFRDFMIRKLEAYGGWVINPDIDEFLDYPGSRNIGLGEILKYCNRNNFNAIAVNSIDLFPREAESQWSCDMDEFFKQSIYYDLKDAYSYQWPCELPIQAPSGIRPFRGGVRRRLFRDRIQLELTKMLFFRSGSGVKLRLDNPHVCRNVRLADFNCIFKHYKFLPNFRYNVQRIVQEESHWNGSKLYKDMEHTLREEKDLVIWNESCNRYSGTESVFPSEFCHVSEQFVESFLRI